ncbi:MAG: hypothetical protein H6Q31_1184 [Bacteroidetes bacterium]|jgi:hypothetical protein|nr:hypothetical protein [Bacteroidota bacterium]
MTKNIGSADRIIRTLLAIVFGILILTGQVEGTLAIILGIIAVVLLLTSAVSVCPLYMLLKTSTLKQADKK